MWEQNPTTISSNVLGLVDLCFCEGFECVEGVENDNEAYVHVKGNTDYQIH